MLVRFHWCLKISLKTFTDCTQWLELLPLVPLVSHNAPQRDADNSPAELLSWTTLALPCEVVMETHNNNLLYPTSYVDWLRHNKSRLSPFPTKSVNRKTQITKDLRNSTYVWVRLDRAKNRYKPHIWVHTMSYDELISILFCKLLEPRTLSTSAV